MEQILLKKGSLSLESAIKRHESQTVCGPRGRVGSNPTPGAKNKMCYILMFSLISEATLVIEQ